MGKKHLYQKIYDTLHLDEDEALMIVGGGELYKRRFEMETFLEENEWDLLAYKRWLAAGKRPEFIPDAPPAQADPKPPGLPTMVRNFMKAMRIAIRSRFMRVSDKEQDRRHNICKEDCQWYMREQDRCAKCGCWLTFKSRLREWHCPLGKW